MSSTYRRAKSDTLKSAFAPLLLPKSSAPLETISIIETARQTSPRDSVSQFEARLWILTQKQLFNPLAAWRLKPIAWNDQPAAQEMLDQGSSPLTLVGTELAGPVSRSTDLDISADSRLDEYRAADQLCNRSNDAQLPDASLLDDFDVFDEVDPPKVGIVYEPPFSPSRSLLLTNPGPVSGRITSPQSHMCIDAADDMLLDDGLCSDTASLLSI